MTGDILILVILLLLSGFFSSAETALFSISSTRARHLRKNGGRTEALIERMKKDSHKLLTTILIGNNIVNVGASALATVITLRLFPNYAVGLATGAMTFLILVFGEVLPKSFATRNNVAIARLTIYPIYWLSVLFWPVLLILGFIPKLTGRMQKNPSVTEDELMTFVEVVEEVGQIKTEERNLIHNIFEFDDTKASEIMTPRADMFVIDILKPLNLEELAKTGYTRVPVIEGDIDHVIGIITTKDLLLYQITHNGDADLRKIMRKAYFVPENKKLDSLLTQFKKRRNHLAIVVDEHGGVSGLISLEDVIEELVGEIEDETDKVEPQITKTAECEWRVPGRSDIEDVNATTGMQIADSSEYDTFSGYVLDVIGKIPQENEEFAFGPYIVAVKRKEGNRIQEYLVRKVK